jgi:hypothetical protein
MSNKNETERKIYSFMYQAAARKWIKRGALSHAAAFYAHDLASIIVFSYGLREPLRDAVAMLERRVSIARAFAFRN